MGKSTVAAFYESRGETIIDCDEIAREIVQPGSEALQVLRERFGEGIIGENGGLDRKKLAAKVFANEKARCELEGVLHPRIRATWSGRVKQAGLEGKRRVFVVIPLLFETGAEKEFSKTICVGCSRETQIERLGARGWSEGEMAGRMAAQWEPAKKMDLSDYVIWSEGSISVCDEQALRILQRISQ